MGRARQGFATHALRCRSWNPVQRIPWAAWNVICEPMNKNRIEGAVKRSEKLAEAMVVACLGRRAEGMGEWLPSFRERGVPDVH